MNMNPEEIRKLINELKQDTVPNVHATRTNPNKVMLADHFDILSLDKDSAKKLSEGELKSLVLYGLDYMDQYQEGRFMYKRGSVNENGVVSSIPGRTMLADFDETGVFMEMTQVIGMLKAELNRRV
jgi:hypothetical protein